MILMNRREVLRAALALIGVAVAKPSIAVDEMSPVKSGDLIVIGFDGVQFHDATAPIRVSSITRTGSLATVTTTTAHGFAPGMLMHIEGATETSYDGHFTIAEVPAADVFSYHLTGSPASPARGRIVARAVASGPLIGSYRYRYRYVSR